MRVFVFCIRNQVKEYVCVQYFPIIIKMTSAFSLETFLIVSEQGSELSYETPKNLHCLFH